MATAWLDADWPAPASVRALTTLRCGLGVSSAPFDTFNLGNCAAADGDDPAVVERNRGLLVELARLPSAPCWLRQVHGIDVARFDAVAFAPLLANAGGGGEGVKSAVGLHCAQRESSAQPLPYPSGPQAQPSGVRPYASQWPASASPYPLQAREGADHAQSEADAAVTLVPGTVLAILTADCLPVLLCSDDGSEVAAAHAGWRGLANGVLEATLKAMQTPAARVMAWLGPAAGPQHYEVGVEVYDAFVAQDWAAGRAFTSTRPHHWRVDLFALARQRLEKAGLALENIHGGDLCTIADPQRFYSHRRDRRTGRMASLIWMDPEC